MFGVQSAEGIVTVATSLQQAKDWVAYKHQTGLGAVGEELVKFANGEWHPHGLDNVAEAN